MIGVGDPLRALRGHGLPLPKGVPASLAEEMDTLGHEFVGAVMGAAGSLELRRLSSGLVLADMHAELMAAKGQQSPLRCVVRSAHDVTISGLLAALGLSLHSWPGFGSSVVVELLREVGSGAFCVRVACHDGVPGDQAALVDVMVPLQAWETTVAPLLLSETEYLFECRLPDGTASPPPAFW